MTKKHFRMSSQFVPQGSEVTRQEQIVVAPNTATYAPLKNNDVHFGQTRCPFCSELTVIAGPKQGFGCSWIYQSCKHSKGLAAGDGLDITVLFEGAYNDQKTLPN